MEGKLRLTLEEWERSLSHVGPFLLGAPPSRVRRHSARAAALSGASDASAGESMCYADLIWWDLLQQFETLAPGCLADMPKLRKLCAACAAHPRVAAYVASPAFIDRPYNNLQAKFK